MNFQANASRQGFYYESIIERMFEKEGLTFERGVKEVGCEFDFVIGKVYFEVKGSNEGSRPGCLRTDTLKKAIANAALLKSVNPEACIILTTSHVPKSGCGKEMLDIALKAGYFQQIWEVPYT